MITKEERWKQNSVNDQMIAILSGVAGDIDNLLSIFSPGLNETQIRSISRVKDNVSDLLKLALDLPKVPWKEDDKDTTKS